MEFHSLKIEALKKETPNAVSILFEVPGPLEETYRFVAGQYLTLQTEISGTQVRRDYSVCSTADDEELKVVVKKVADGFFSKYACDELAVGVILEVAPPQGRFTFSPKEASSQDTILAIAAGSGITPIISVVKTALTQSEASVQLLYGNKSISDTIFYDEIIALQASYPERFSCQFIFSQERNENGLFGRIESSTIKYVLNQMSMPTSVYLCGPEPLIHLSKDTLIEKGLSESQIKFELFSASAPASTTISASGDGESNITVLVDDEEFSFSMKQSSTILEEAIKNDIDTPYSCQGGICSSCIARVTEGEVEMRQNNILTDSELREGLILTCQAEPKSAVVKIDYDDV